MEILHFIQAFKSTASSSCLVAAAEKERTTRTELSHAGLDYHHHYIH